MRKNWLAAELGRVTLSDPGPVVTELVTQVQWAKGPRRGELSSKVSAMVRGQSSVTSGAEPVRAIWMGPPITMLPALTAEAVPTLEVTVQLYVPAEA